MLARSANPARLRTHFQGERQRFEELPTVRPVRLDLTGQALVDSAVAQAQKAGPIDAMLRVHGMQPAAC